MSIADYSDLLVQVAEYTGRDDFGHQFPRLVSFAENKLNRVLRVGGMETSTTLTTSSSGNVALPAGFLEMREVKNSSGVVIDATVPRAGDELFGPYAGTTALYYIKGGTFYSIPYSEHTFSIVYYTKITALTPTNTTNWLLTDAPLIYLYGVCAEVAGWALATGRDAETTRVQGFAQMLQTEIEAYQGQDRDKRFANARIIVRGANP